MKSFFDSRVKYFEFTSMCEASPREMSEWLRKVVYETKSSLVSSSTILR